MIHVLLCSPRLPPLQVGDGDAVCSNLFLTCGRFSMPVPVYFLPVDDHDFFTVYVNVWENKSNISPTNDQGKTWVFLWYETGMRLVWVSSTGMRLIDCIYFVTPRV